MEGSVYALLRLRDTLFYAVWVHCKEFKTYMTQV
jgi:hypothetical protein